jgi:hypothetical protein
MADQDDVAPLLLRESLARSDVLDLTVEDLGGQNYRAVVHGVLTNRFCRLASDVRKLEFVGGTSAWGNATLKSGERAFVFLSRIQNRCYENHWQGHLTLEVINGRLLAVAPWHLANHRYGPQYLLESATVPDPSRPWRTAFPVELIERHIRELAFGSGI